MTSLVSCLFGTILLLTVVAVVADFVGGSILAGRRSEMGGKGKMVVVLHREELEECQCPVL